MEEDPFVNFVSVHARETLKTVAPARHQLIALVQWCWVMLEMGLDNHRTEAEVIKSKSSFHTSLDNRPQCEHFTL